jgi:hypothetical protein
LAGAGVFVLNGDVRNVLQAKDDADNKKKQGSMEKKMALEAKAQERYKAAAAKYKTHGLNGLNIENIRALLKKARKCQYTVTHL